MRRFNVTGLCVPEKHYMADISDNIEKIKAMIDNEEYFTINRPRQYGKTTTLTMLERRLRGLYICLLLSFEGIGAESFESSKAFCGAFLQLIKNRLNYTPASEEPEYIKAWDNPDVNSMISLSMHISKMCAGRKIVLIIDEVDKSSNNLVFIQFLGMLRDKFLSRERGEGHTFQSVILAGIYDIKNIELTVKSERVYNSPWNIAAEFNVSMSLNPDRIKSMLAEYELEHETGMDINAVSNEIFKFTGGYPFLASMICLIIESKLSCDWTVDGVKDAVRLILDETNTLYDDLFKKLENYPDLYGFIYDLLIVGERKSFVLEDPKINLAHTLGMVKNVNGSAVISNKIFEIKLINYFVSKVVNIKNQGIPAPDGWT